MIRWHKDEKIAQVLGASFDFIEWKRKNRSMQLTFKSSDTTVDACTKAIEIHPFASDTVVEKAPEDGAVIVRITTDRVFTPALLRKCFAQNTQFGLMGFVEQNNSPSVCN